MVILSIPKAILVAVLLLTIVFIVLECNRFRLYLDVEAIGTAANQQRTDAGREDTGTAANQQRTDAGREDTNIRWNSIDSMRRDGSHEVHDRIGITDEGLKRLFNIMAYSNKDHQSTRFKSRLVETNVGDTARLTLCTRSDNAVWITVGGHFRSFANTIKNVFWFLHGNASAEDQACRFMVLFTRELAEAGGERWDGKRESKSVNSKIHVISELRRMEETYFKRGNFFWVVTKASKDQRLTDMELMSFIFAKRLKTYHDEFRWQYVKWSNAHRRGNKTTHDDSGKSQLVILGSDQRPENDSFAEVRDLILAEMLQELVRNGSEIENESIHVRRCPAPCEPFKWCQASRCQSRQLLGLQTQCCPRVWERELDSFDNTTQRRLEHVFIRTRPDLTYNKFLNFRQIANSMRSFRKVYIERGNSFSVGPSVILGFVLLHDGSFITHLDPSDMFALGSESYFDAIYASALKNKAWPGFVWPNFVTPPRETLKTHKINPVVGGVFVIPQGFQVNIIRPDTGKKAQVHRINPRGDPFDKCHPPHCVKDVFDISRDAIRFPRLKTGIDKVKGAPLPKTREHLTEPKLRIYIEEI